MSLEDLNRADLLWAYQMDVGHAKAEIERLKAENAALRERLNKAVELTEPHWELCPYSGMYIVYYKAIVPKSEGYDDRAAAEACVAELRRTKWLMKK